MKKVIFLTLMCTIFAYSCSCLQIKNFLLAKVKPAMYSGTIQYKFIDDMDRGDPKVVFTNSDTITIDAFECWDNIEIGDSLSKPKGSLRYTLFRNQKKVGSYYPKCNNKEIK